jgi:hypothetical protein
VLNFSAIVDLFNSSQVRAGRAAQILLWRPLDFTRDEFGTEAAGHLIRELPIRVLPPEGGNPTEGDK